MGAHLYDVVFPTKPLNDNSPLQNEAGIFFLFGAPGSELLLAANRDLTTKRVNEDEKDILTFAAAILATSTEPDLAAKQPQPENRQTISPVSIFTSPNKTLVISSQSQVVLPPPTMN
ncbi:MAG: hypothetical protein KF702_06060 [Gammaproteobacteria bacterium]|nr:hypothetical protein [Gammaproteobacteria bacterium]